LTETGVFDTDTGAAAGRQADESKKAKVKRQKQSSFTETILHEFARNLSRRVRKRHLYICRFTFYLYVDANLPAESASPHQITA